MTAHGNDLLAELQLLIEEAATMRGDGIARLRVADRSDLPPGHRSLLTSIIGLIDENDRLTTTVAQLSTALESRVVIEQAKGALGERLGIEPAAAFVIIRNRARREGSTLVDVARDVVGSVGRAEAGSLPTPVPDRGDSTGSARPPGPPR